MVITKEIVSACRKAVDQAGSQSELSRRSRVSQQVISEICSVNRKRQSISNLTFIALLPYLRKYLSPDLAAEYMPAPVPVPVPPPPADYILDRITEIYAQLDRAERAELLAAAERILEHRKGEK